jgi:3-hydroxyisobutyrate dehydrogenase-like beta-hydroxyacid dehydrogenase
MNEQGGVAVLGLGNMGKALAGALLNRGYQVTVWNRTSDRADPLVSRGAILAPSPAAAVTESRLIIVCVLDYKAADAILASPGVDQALADKTLVQLSSGTLNEVSAQKTWVEEHGGRFLAGGILASPLAIGRPNSLIVYAGNAAAFEQHRSTLSSLGGSSQYLGTNPHTAIGTYFALGTYIFGTQGLFYETAALARHYGLSIRAYYELMQLVTQNASDAVCDGTHRVLTGQFNDSQASIGLWLAYMQDAARTFEQTGIPAIITAALVKQLELGITRGDGDKDVARITELLWGASQDRL